MTKLENCLFVIKFKGEDVLVKSEGAYVSELNKLYIKFVVDVLEDVTPATVELTTFLKSGIPPSAAFPASDGLRGKRYPFNLLI
jgi:hypothetical protein